MKILKYILIFLLIVAVGLAIYTAIQPSEYDFTRSRTIEAPAEVVYSEVDDYRNWEDWGPWHEDDPTIEATYDEKSSGEDVSYRWTSEQGEGSATRMEYNPHESLSDKLDFGGMGSSTAYWKFEPQGEATEVTWGMKAENVPFIMKFFGAISGGYENMMGPMFERGLERLDSVAQIQAEEYKSNMTSRIGEISEKQLEAQNFIGYSHSSKTDDFEGMKAIFEESMPKVGIYVAESGLQQGDYVPGAIYTKWDEEKGETDFVVGVFLMKDLSPKEDMQQMNLPSGKVVMVSKFGNYGVGDEDAHNAINQYITENNLTINGPIYEMYVNDPTSVKPSEIQTDIYYPVK